MKSKEFICLSACSMVLTALGIDVMLPALGALREHFQLGNESTATSQIISFFFMGQVAQFAFGAASDRFGRIFVLRIGFPLYVVGGIATAFAPTLGWMYFWRFVAGIGAAGVFTTTIAGIRDRYVGDQMARIMSFVLAIFLFTPILAPFLGQWILNIASWKEVFLAPPVFATAVFLWSFRLDESLPLGRRVRGSIAESFRLAAHVLRNRTFIRYAGITTVLFTAFSAYISSSERIVGEIYGRPDLFTWLFAGTGVIMSIGTLINSQLARRYGARRTFRALLNLYFLIAASMLAVTLLVADPPPMSVFFILIALLTGVNLAIEPNSSALALEPVGATAGLAASLYGTMFFFLGAGVGAVISHHLVHQLLPLTASFFAIAVATQILARISD